MTATETARTPADRTAINALISARILLALRSGMDERTAFDHVLGAGAFDRMAGELYDALRNR